MYFFICIRKPQKSWPSIFLILHPEKGDFLLEHLHWKTHIFLLWRMTPSLSFNFAMKLKYDFSVWNKSLFPQIWVNWAGAWNASFQWEWNTISPETNPYGSFPKFESMWKQVKAGPHPVKPFLGTLWWKKVNRSDSISTFMYVGGLINRFHPVSCPRSDSTRPLLFSHPLSGGHRSRPSLLGRQGYLADCSIDALLARIG